MFWKRQGNRLTAVGVAKEPSGTAIAVIEGAGEERPRVLYCNYLGNTTADFVDFCKDHGLRKSMCVDVLPTDTYSFMQVDIQGVNEEERRDAVRWQIRELLDYPAEEAIIELIEVPTLGNEEKVQTFAVAASRRNLKERIGQLQQVELYLDAIDIPEFSLRNLLTLYLDEPRGLCMLWVRPDSTLLIITRGGTFYFSRLINIGMTQLLQGAESVDDGFLSENQQMQLDAVVLEVQRSLDYCESNFRLPAVPKILVAMCDEEPAEIIDYLNRYLQAEVVSADLRQVLDLPLDIDPPTINSCLPALGAALRAGGRE